MSIALEAKVADLEERVKSLETKAECYVMAKSLAEDLGFETVAQAMNALRASLKQNNQGKRNG